MSILVIVPSRGRPMNAFDLKRAFYKTTSGGITGECGLYFMLDDDDPLLPSYQNLLGEGEYEIGKRDRIGPLLNRCVADILRYETSPIESTFDVIGFMSDKSRPRTQGWDVVVEDALAAKPAVLCGKDLIQGERMSSSAFISIELVRHLGYMVPPTPGHLYSDFWKAVVS
jgi:hypothetical protein